MQVWEASVGDLVLTIFQTRQINWTQRTPSSFIPDLSLNAHFPWSDGTLYVDHASRNTGRLSLAGQTDLTGSINSYFYERNGAEAKLYLNGSEIGSVNNLTSALSSEEGRFTIGSHYGSLFANMNFYWETLLIHR